MKGIALVGLGLVMWAVAGAAEASVPDCAATAASVGAVYGGNEYGQNPPVDIVSQSVQVCALALDPFFTGTRNVPVNALGVTEVDPAAAGLEADPVTAFYGGYLAQWRTTNGDDFSDRTQLLAAVGAGGPAGEALLLAHVTSDDSDHPGCGTCNLHRTAHSAVVALDTDSVDARVEAYQLWQEFRTGTAQSQGVRASVAGPVDAQAHVHQDDVNGECSEGLELVVTFASGSAATSCPLLVPLAPAPPAFPTYPV